MALWGPPDRRSNTCPAENLVQHLLFHPRSGVRVLLVDLGGSHSFTPAKTTMDGFARAETRTGLSIYFCDPHSHCVWKLS